MVVQLKEDFASYANLTAHAKFTADANPAHFDANNASTLTNFAVKTDSLPSVFTSSIARTIYYRIVWSVDTGGGAANSQQLTAGLYVYDGTNYLFFYSEQATSTGSNGRPIVAFNNILRTTSGLDDFDLGDDVDVTLIGFEQWTWFKCVINTDNSLEMYYNNDNVTVKPTDSEWTNLNISLSKAMGTITEMACFVEFNSGANGGDDLRFDDMEIVSGEGNPIDNAIIDGSTVKIASLYARNTLGQPGATLKLKYHDPTYILDATVESAHRTVITASETRFNTRVFQGEVISTDPFIREIVATGIQSKLERTLSAYDPVLTSGFVEYIEDNILYKQDIGANAGPIFSSFGSLADKLMVFVKTNPKFYQCGPNTVLPVDILSASVTPDATAGSITNLFFDDPDASDEDNTRYFRDADPFYVEIVFKAIIKNGTTLDKAVINLTVAHSARTLSDPTIELFDFNNSLWRTFTKDDFGDWGNEDNLSELNADSRFETYPVKVEIDIKNVITTGVFSDYSDVSITNNFGFKTHEYKLRLFSNTPVVSTEKSPLVKVIFAQMKFDLDIDQAYAVGVAKIKTVNDHNLVFYTGAETAWLDEDIRDDGISGGGLDIEGNPIGDRFYITDKLSDIATALWTASGMDLKLNLNFEITDEIPDIEDATRVMVLNWMQKVSELTGAAYWIDYTTDPKNDLPTFNIANSFVDSGLTLTDADFIEPFRQVSYKVDSSQEMSTLNIVAKDGLIGSAAITVEHTPDLGLESVRISRPDIHTSRQMAFWLIKKALLYTNAQRFFSARINYDRANQDYSSLTVGKEVTVLNPADGSIVNHQAGQKEKLLIFQMELNRNWNNGYSNYFTILFQRRFV